MPSTPAQAVGNRIRTLRQSRDLTQKVLARALHVSQPAVSQWERGVKIPALPMQYLLADFLSVPRSFLFAEVVKASEEAA